MGQLPILITVGKGQGGPALDLRDLRRVTIPVNEVPARLAPRGLLVLLRELA